MIGEQLSAVQLAPSLRLSLTGSAEFAHVIPVTHGQKGSSTESQDLVAETTRIVFN